MNNSNWKRAAIGVCTTTALVVGAGLAFAPAANAAPATNPTSSSNSLLGGATTGVTGVVNNLLGGTTTTPLPTSTSSSPVTIGTGDGGVSVGIGGTGVGVTTGGGTGIGVVVGTGGGSGVGVAVGGTGTGVGVDGGVSGGTGGTGGTGGNGGAGGTGGTGSTGGTGGNGGGGTGGGTTTPPVSTAPAMLSAISVTTQYTTVYPAKDGYRDTNTFTLNGTASDGLQHTANGTLTLTFGSSTVQTWPITATNQQFVWNGLKGGKLVPGSYTVTAVISDADGHQISGKDRVAVSAKRIKATSTTITTKSVSGKKKMDARPLAGLSKGKVTLRVLSSVKGIKGKQYLVFSHGGKKVKVLIRNGKHTSAAVTIPKSFTTFTVSHTWKTSKVKIKSLKYKYAYKALK